MSAFVYACSTFCIDFGRYSTWKSAVGLTAALPATAEHHSFFLRNPFCLTLVRIKPVRLLSTDGQNA